jgi:hypothetical protein
MTTPLLPCKKCGSIVIKCLSSGPERSEYRVKAQGFTLQPGAWAAFCATTNCAVGPLSETAEAAREAWNQMQGADNTHALVGHAAHRGLDTRTAPAVDPHAISMPILDAFIASALKELGLDPFLVLPEQRLEYMKMIMLGIMSLRSLVEAGKP